MLEGKTTLEELVDKECLANASPAIYGNDLRPVFFHGRLQFLYFRLTSNHSVNIYFQPQI
jgi:hypothetical protein